MEIKLERIDSKFQFKSGSGDQEVYTCASEALQGNIGKGQRPMALVLNGLAACMSIDILNILYKQKQLIKNFSVLVKAERDDAPPSAFRKINIIFSVHGDVKSDLLEKAINLTREKYCSVYHSLSSSIEVTFNSEINE